MNEQNSITDQVLEMLTTIAKELENIRALGKPEAIQYESEQTQKLYEALAKAQGEMGVAKLDAENPYFKSRYASYTSLVQASRGALAKQGLGVVFRKELDKDGRSLLIGKLTHSSGQWVTSIMRLMPPKNDIQSLGSYESYCMRYIYKGLVGVVIGDGDDDDGELAVAPIRYQQEKGTGINTKYNPKEQSFDTITKDQLEELEYELEEYPDIGEMILEKLQLQTLADMPKSKYRASIERVREIKHLRNNP